MSLGPGSTIGPFKIQSLIGKGGMGEVFSAVDTRLERSVAIKVLPPEFSSDMEIRARFEREARAISNLTHPNICTLYDIGRENGTDYLVMERLEGQTLAERLGKGALPLDQALEYGIQIAAALDRAHRAGIVHRDLKPGNIMLTKTGVKLLDFGLAKLVSKSVQTPAEDQATLLEKTSPGMILGTVQYMAPEQIEAGEVDHRTDIFAFGCVLYEMITGKKAFEGKSATSVMAAILEREPEPVHSHQPLSPSNLDGFLKHCLAKSPNDRWQAAHDLSLQLKSIRERGSDAGQRTSAARKRRDTVLLAIAGLLTLALLLHAVVRRSENAAAAKVVRFEIPPPPLSAVDSVALSPSGRKIALVARGLRDRTQLWIRSVDTFAMQPVPGSDGAAFPFWSPDESAIGFFAGGALKKLDCKSGVIVTLCKAENGRGGSWSAKGTILFAPERIGGLHQVPAAGGDSAPVTPNLNIRSVGHRWPWFLPDGDHFLYWSQSGPADDAQSGQILVSSLRSPDEANLLVSAADNAVYASGHLLYARSGNLIAAPFDPRSRKLTGPAMPMAENVERVLYGAWTAVFSASAEGTLAYLPATRMQGSELVWFKLDGTRSGKVGRIAPHYDVRISPDGRSASVSIRDESTATFDLWIFDLERNSSMRITTDRSDDLAGVWSPDGRRLVFASNRKQGFNLYLKELGSVEPERLLFESDETKFPLDWSWDGKHLLFVSISPETKADLWVLPITDGSPKAELFLKTRFNEEGSARFSPDGKWIVYVSDEQGPHEVFGVSFPDRRGKQKLSSEGGTTPCWSRDGSAIYYTDPDNYLTKVEVLLEDSRLVPSVPKRLFPIQPIGIYSSFEVAPDGKRVLVSTGLEISNAAPVKMVLNWPAELQRK